MLIKTRGRSFITMKRTLKPVRANICLLTKGAIVKRGFHGE